MGEPEKRTRLSDADDTIGSLYHGPISCRLAVISIGNHRLDAMNIRAEAPQLDLLALACLDSKRISVHPLVRRYISRF